MNVELRDYFAAHAPPFATLSVADLVALGVGQSSAGWQPTQEDWELGRALLRYRVADAMLRARQIAVPA